MHRQPLLEVLERYLLAFPGERAVTGRVREFVRLHRDCFERACPTGHVTASAWIVSPERTRVLLTHHRKLGVWLQLGGHADGETDTERVALCEAREESGLRELAFVPDPGGMRVLDLDVHQIPARPEEPAHVHHDVCYLLVAAASGPLRISQESADLRWFGWEEAAARIREPSQLRKARKARERLGLSEHYSS